MDDSGAVEALESDQQKHQAARKMNYGRHRYHWARTEVSCSPGHLFSYSDTLLFIWGKRGLIPHVIHQSMINLFLEQVVLYLGSSS